MEYRYDPLDPWNIIPVELEEVNRKLDGLGSAAKCTLGKQEDLAEMVRTLEDTARDALNSIVRKCNEILKQVKESDDNADRRSRIRISELDGDEATPSQRSQTAKIDDLRVKVDAMQEQTSRISVISDAVTDTRQGVRELIRRFERFEESTREASSRYEQIRQRDQRRASETKRGASNLEATADILGYTPLTYVPDNEIAHTLHEQATEPWMLIAPIVFEGWVNGRQYEIVVDFAIETSITGLKPRQPKRLRHKAWVSCPIKSPPTDRQFQVTSYMELEITGPKKQSYHVNAAFIQRWDDAIILGRDFTSQAFAYVNHHTRQICWRHPDQPNTTCRFRYYHKFLKTILPEMAKASVDFDLSRHYQQH